MKKNFDFIFDVSSEKPNTTQPFSLMRSKDMLPEDNFIIWKLSYEKQNIHAHDYYQMWYVFRGSCDHMIDNKKFHLRDGDIIIIPPYSYHSMYNGSENLVVIGIDFSESFFSSADSDDKFVFSCISPLFFKQQSSSSKFPGDEEIENLILETFSEYIHRNDFYKTIIRGNILKLLIMINRKSNTAGHAQNDHNYLVNKILKFIHNNLNTQIRIEELCTLTNASASLIGLCFKKATGKTVIEYVNSLKVDKAKQLLKETDITITNISYDLGFNDIAYFNRVFKKTTGQSPKNYRKSHIL